MFRNLCKKQYCYVDYPVISRPITLEDMGPRTHNTNTKISWKTTVW